MFPLADCFINHLWLSCHWVKMHFQGKGKESQRRIVHINYYPYTALMIAAVRLRHGSRSAWNSQSRVLSKLAPWNHSFCGVGPIAAVDALPPLSTTTAIRHVTTGCELHNVHLRRDTGGLRNPCYNYCDPGTHLVRSGAIQIDFQVLFYVNLNSLPSKYFYPRWPFYQQHRVLFETTVTSSMQFFYQWLKHSFWN